MFAVESKLVRPEEIGESLVDGVLLSVGGSTDGIRNLGTEYLAKCLSVLIFEFDFADPTLLDLIIAQVDENTPDPSQLLQKLSEISKKSKLLAKLATGIHRSLAARNIFPPLDAQ